MTLLDEFNQIFPSSGSSVKKAQFPITIRETNPGVKGLGTVIIEDNLGCYTPCEIPRFYYDPGVKIVPKLFTGDNCDGIQLILSDQGRCHLVLIELKSTLGNGDIAKASKQLLYSFLKFRCFLVSCISSDAVLQNVTAIMCFKNYKDTNQENYYMELHRKSTANRLSRDERWCLHLVLGKPRKIQLKDFWELKGLPLHPSIADVEIEFRLYKTDNHTDTSLTLNVSDII